MKIEIKRDYIFIDGKQFETNTVFGFGGPSFSKGTRPNYLDFRAGYAERWRVMDEIEFINNSGRNIYLVSTSDWFATLHNGQKIKAHKGYMEYNTMYV